jgi:hypothetical protein
VAGEQREDLVGHTSTLVAPGAGLATVR